MSDNLVMNMPNIPGYNNTLLIAREDLSMGVNDNINTKVIAHTLSRDLSKPTPTKRIPIDTHTSGKAESNIESKHILANATKVNKEESKPATMTKPKSKTDPNAASRTSSKVTNPTNEIVDKHRSIYQSSDNSNQFAALDAHDHMKTLLIVSGVLGGLGYMYFYRH